MEAALWKRKGEIEVTNEVFQRAEVGRMRIHVLPTKRFKTFAISLYAGRPLSEQTVTSTALLPHVLRRGTARTPQTSVFRQRLDEMYGAGFGFDIYKRADAQLVQFRLDVIHDRFVVSSRSLLEEALRLLGEVTGEPALENGHLIARYVEQEKQILASKLQAIVNDKIRYAAERCMEEMFAADPYRLHALGNLEQLADITPESLYADFHKWLQTATFDLYVAGDTTLEQVEKLVRSTFRTEAGSPGSYAAPRLAAATDGPPKIVVERLEVSQGKLNMGLTTQTGYADEAYPALLLFNGILGGFAHSKLFVNVREKASLAYYASSRLDGHKGVIAIQSGIEAANYEQANAIIREQLESLKNGQISELELSQTKALLINQLRQSLDSAFEIVALDFNRVLSGSERTVAELLERLDANTAAEVVEAGQHVKVNTIYFLRDQEGTDGGDHDEKA